MIPNSDRCHVDPREEALRRHLGRSRACIQRDRVSRRGLRDSVTSRRNGAATGAHAGAPPALVAHRYRVRSDSGVQRLRRTDPIAPAARSQEGYDFDGDGVPDHGEVASTGGASCCYTLAILSGRTALPFELDAATPVASTCCSPSSSPSPSQPRESRDWSSRSRPANGEPLALPAAWRALGVASHRIAVSLAHGLSANLGWHCDHALRAIHAARCTAWEGMPGDGTPLAVFAALHAAPSAARARLPRRTRIRRQPTPRSPDAAAGAPIRMVWLDLVSPAAAASALRRFPHAGPRTVLADRDRRAARWARTTPSECSRWSHRATAPRTCAGWGRVAVTRRRKLRTPPRCAVAASRTSATPLPYRIAPDRANWSKPA